jgi:glutamate synthase domain-containing protein 1
MGHTLRRLERQGLYDPCFEHDACGVGFVANVHGVASHDIIQKGLTVLQNLTHRGACGCDPLTGDGAGMIMQVPDAFLRKVCGAIDIALPPAGEYGVGLVFLPPDVQERNFCEREFGKIIRQEGQRLLGWRTVPVDDSKCGPLARTNLPEIRQIFIGRGRATRDQAALERKLYIIRKRIERLVRESALADREYFYVPSLSSRTLVYKGLLLPEQIPAFYVDLVDPDMTSALALVHQRFSTNTLPTWDRAHPYRFIAHNGEINTLRSDINWMHARQSRSPRRSSATISRRFCRS